MAKQKSKNEEIRKVLMDAAKAGFNVLLEGPHGVGKSSHVISVAEELGLKMKYFSASTLDPFADLVGIPVPILDGGQRKVEYVRQDSIMDAEMMFFDELNRAHPKTLNAVLEIIQFRSINGEKLPRLRCVFAAINPNDGQYQVLALDPALIDRFQIHVRLVSGPDRDWFETKFGKQMGRALVDWYNSDLDDKQRGNVSNRRLEYIGLAVQSGIDPQLATALDSNLPIHLLKQRLNEDSGLEITDFTNDPGKFNDLVATNIEYAMRFARLLPMMSPAQKVKVKGLILGLHPEALAMLKSKFPFIFKAVHQAIVRIENRAEADAFESLMQPRLAKVSTEGKQDDKRKAA